MITRLKEIQTMHIRQRVRQMVQSSDSTTSYGDRQLKIDSGQSQMQKKLKSRAAQNWINNLRLVLQLEPVLRKF